MRKIFLAAICLFVSVTASAQIPGQNVNMVTGTKFPGGDPWLQKQNEPSGAVSTKNPCRLLVGANDYRAVNLAFPAGLTTDKENGDAWVGWYTSIDCGQTFYSTLVPGYPQDPNGQSSPVFGLTTAADPTVRAGAGGFFAYSFIAFNRGSNVGKVAVARFIDKNNTEAVTGPETAISYIDTKVWDTGSAGQFIDKPTLAVTQGTGTCTINGQTIPASTVHLAWTVFVGNDINIRTKVYYARSSNCGASLDGPATKLSEGYAVNQSASVAVAKDGSVYVVWRQFSTPKGDLNQILVAKSVDGGKTFTKGAPVPLQTPTLQPFDQGTSSKSFRTNAFASTAVDQWGRLYVALAVRGFGTVMNLNQSRIVVTTTPDGITWTMPQAIENNALSGHQIMPAITTVGGNLNVVWLDFLDDVAYGALGGPFQDYIKEIFPLRHTMDVRGAQAPLTQNNNGVLSWTTYGILQEETPAATAPRISRYLTGDYGGQSAHLKQLQWNRPNLKLYAGGTRPFIGDYIDLAGLAYIAKPDGSWVPNEGSIPVTAAQTFYAFWTDNRDAKVGTFPAEDPDDAKPEGAAMPYTMPGTAACLAAGTNPPTKTRNANVYTSRITPGLFVAAPTNSKPSINAKGPIQRAFPVLVQNRTNQPRTFTITIVPPTNGIATFQQVPWLGVFPQGGFPSPLPQAVTTLSNITIPPKSSTTRTVFVVSTDRYPQIRVNVTEILAPDAPPGSTPLLGSTLLNFGSQNTDIGNPDIENQELHNADIQNPDIENPDIENPDIENPDIENPDIENPDIENPDIENPDIENADILNPDIENPDIENPDIENPDIENGAVTDFSVNLSNKGNTASSYQVKFAVGGNTGGYIFQLIGRRLYKTPSASGCVTVEKTQNQILFNLTDPDVSAAPLPDATSPAAQTASNATILVAPGETLKVTLRVFDKDGVTIRNPLKQGGGGDGIKPFCPIVDQLGAKCPQATNPLTVLVKAAAADTGSNTPFEEILPLNPAGAVTVTTTTLPFATLNTPYSQQLQATGGLGNYTWSIASGALPTGVTLSPTGLLSGTPTTGGPFPFVASASDGIQSDTQSLALQVAVVVGSLTDPSGDAIVTTGTPSPDLVSATVLNIGTALVFRIRFAPGTFDPATSYAQVLLDTDQNPATGHPGVNSGCQTDASIIGSEYLVNMQSSTGEIMHYTGTCNSFSFVSSATVATMADGYDVTVPLAAIGSVDGVLNFKFTTSKLISPPGGYTGVLDVMSNVGLPAGTTTIPGGGGLQ